MAADGEFSVEIDPNEIDDARLDALAASGMNRASIGVQDFDPLIQKSIGREQSYALTRDVAERIRARGVASLNADILYGLPHQTGPRIADSVQKLLTLSPDRVALYGYAHVPWMSRRQQMIPSDAMPTPEERLALFETARQLFRGTAIRRSGSTISPSPRTGWPAPQRDGHAEAQLPGLYRRPGPGADRAWRLVDLALSAGLCAERLGHGANIPRRSAPGSFRPTGATASPARTPCAPGSSRR